MKQAEIIHLLMKIMKFMKNMKIIRIMEITEALKDIKMIQKSQMILKIAIAKIAKDVKNFQITIMNMNFIKKEIMKLMSETMTIIKQLKNIKIRMEIIIFMNILEQMKIMMIEIMKDLKNSEK